MHWKSRLIELYRITESSLQTLVPKVTDEQIDKFISNNKWLVIPTSLEFNKKDSINRPDPNMFINLSESGKIELGIVCNTLKSVERMKNILHGFHGKEKTLIIDELSKLDGTFNTTLEKKIKHDNYAQTPIYEIDIKVPSQLIDDSTLHRIFQRSDEILIEGRLEMKQRKISWLPVSPHLNLALAWLDDNDDVFKEKVKQLEHVYEIALKIKTDKEIVADEKRRNDSIIAEKQKQFAMYVQELKDKNISGSEYREQISKWQKAH
jgi:hypothetical protein